MGGEIVRFLVPVGGVTDGIYGVITAPNHKGIPAGIKAGLPWAADVGCLEGPAYVKRINWQTLIPWLKVMKPYRDNCLFIAGGDIVADAAATLEAYEEVTRYFGHWTAAYVVQNGAESLPIPEDCSAVFIGGDTEYKLSKEAIGVMLKAQQMGKHVHIGRVNWGKRYRHFRTIPGSNNFTCDGTRTRYDGVKKTLEAWQGLEAQPPLFTF